MKVDSIHSDSWKCTVYRVTDESVQRTEWQMKVYSIQSDRWKCSVYRVTDESVKYTEWQMKVFSIQSDWWKFTVYRVTAESVRYTEWQLKVYRSQSDRWNCTVYTTTSFNKPLAQHPRVFSRNPQSLNLQSFHLIFFIWNALTGKKVCRRKRNKSNVHFNIATCYTAEIWLVPFRIVFNDSRFKQALIWNWF